MSPSYKTVLRSRKLRQRSHFDGATFNPRAVVVFLLTVLVLIILGLSGVYQEFSS